MRFTTMARPSNRTAARDATGELNGPTDRECCRHPPRASRSRFSPALRLQYRGVHPQVESRGSIAPACNNNKARCRSCRHRGLCGPKSPLQDFQGRERLDAERVPRDFPPQLTSQDVLSVQDAAHPPSYAERQGSRCNSMYKWFLLLSSLLCSLSVSAQKDKALAITHVTVIDCTGASPKPNSTVVTAGGFITAVGPSHSFSTPADAHVVDGSGKFLIPGLWDMHGHLTDATEGAFPLLIMNGVTGVRDMGGDLAQIDLWRAEIEKGTRVGPRIIRAGPFVDGPKQGATHRLTVRTPEEARQAVDKLKSKGVDFIKVHNGLSREVFFAVADEARKQELPLTVHLPSGLWTHPKGDGVSVAEASEAGARSLEHIEVLLESALYRKGATAKTIEEAIAENSGSAGEALFARLKKNGTWYVPTLVAYYRGFVLWSGNPEETAGSLEIHRKHLELVEAMHKAGVGILAGSDFSDWALVPGVDLHNELALFVEAGFTPMEALQTATLEPAKYLGRLATQGTIEKGKIADLVLLDANPLEDISHTRMINSVVVRGRLFSITRLRNEILN